MTHRPLRRIVWTPAHLSRTVARGALQVAAVGCVLGLWESLSRGEVFPTKYFPAMSVVFHELAVLSVTGRFWHLVGQTMTSWGIGMAIATAAAIPIGIAIGSSETLFFMTRLVLDALRCVPPIVLIPLFILLAGASIKMKVMVIVWAVLWPLLIQTVYGVRSLDPLTVETAKSFRVTAWHRFWLVRMPGALPLIWTGMRLAASGALLGAIVSELLGGASGLGNEILIAEQSANSTVMYALIVATGILGVVVNGVFSLMESRTLRWHASVRERVA